MPDPIVVISEIRGSVIANANLNLRQGVPNTSAAIANKVARGTTLSVTKLVEGQRIAGNAQWYRGEGDRYFWSGGVGAVAIDPPPAGGMNLSRRANGTIRPLRDDEIRAAYGDLRVTEQAGGRVKLDPAWVACNIVEISVPMLEPLGAATLQVHTKAQAPFLRVFEQIEATGLASSILTFGGTWVPRHKGWIATRPLSAHTWGIAIDLNVAWNGYGRVPTALGEHGSVRQLVSIFESAGFAWGGYFEPLTICDGMHFELARID